VSPVKIRRGAKQGPTAERLAILLDVLSPWDGISLTYRQFAAELGAPVTAAAVKKWPYRKQFPTDAARVIVAKAAERRIGGVTLEWVLWGDGPGPKKVPKAILTSPHGEASPPRAPQEPHGRFSAEIGEALQADLSHNEFGQWSSVEVQHTVTWALKDLARRLRALRFDMGRTFELTDEWAGKIGLPVRPPAPSADKRGPEASG
jgi:hypothetical protein